MSRCMGKGDGDETVKIETVNIDSVKVQVRQKWSSGPRNSSPMSNCGKVAYDKPPSNTGPRNHGELENLRDTVYHKPIKIAYS